jgi:hypothetical protein
VWEGEGDQRKGSGGSESGQDTPIIVEEGSWWGRKKKKVRWGGGGPLPDPLPSQGEKRESLRVWRGKAVTLHKKKNSKVLWRTEKEHYNNKNCILQN